MVPSNFDWTHDLSVRTARRELNKVEALFNLQIKPVMISVEDSLLLDPNLFIEVTRAGCE